MGTRGRAKPTALKLIQGNPGKRALPQDEPQPEVDGTMPTWVKDKVARKWWPIVTKHLLASGVLTTMDKDGLALYLEQFTRYLAARDRSEGKSMIYVTNTGALAIIPEYKIMDDCHDRMLKILIEYGCTPASRTRVKVATGKPKANKFARIAGAGRDTGDDE